MGIFIGNQVVSPLGIASVYVGNQKVYDKTASRLLVKFNVTKIISNVYDSTASQSYTDCKFIGFNVTTGDTPIDVEYGGITKNIPANTTTAITFGQYAADPDDGTPDTGDISFIGDVEEIAGFSYSINKNTTGYFNGINAIINFGSLKRIGNHLFRNNTLITTVRLPDTLISIGQYAFANCTNLSTVQFSNSITDIGIYAFSDCTNLNFEALPTSLKILGSRSFANCTSLTGVNGRLDIPNTIEGLDLAALNNTAITKSNTNTSNTFDLSSCTHLAVVHTFMPAIPHKLYLPNSVTYLIVDANTEAINSSTTGYFDLRNITNLTTFSCSNNLNMTHIHFPTTLTRILTDSFISSFCVDCTNLTTVNSTIEGLCDLTQFTDLGYYDMHPTSGPFYNSGIRQIRFNETITVIPCGVAARCKKLIDIVIPASVTRIGEESFIMTGAGSVNNKDVSSVVFRAPAGWTYLDSVSSDGTEHWYRLSEADLSTPTYYRGGSTSLYGAARQRCGRFTSTGGDGDEYYGGYADKEWKRST